ncbi:MAG TPA: HPP family protein [Oxalicibacterium sp.]|jgi:CBS domain-containing membrane protein|nr:HPP family protein [Oxalicibacterium sp.]
MQTRFAWLNDFLPSSTSVDRYERMRASAGALFGIVLTGLICYLILGKDPASFWLIAPMGASSVLLFAVPSSPLAQPWSLIGGNLVAALVGVTCTKLVGEPILAAGLAISIAIGGMFMLRCIHPPSGAVALTAVLGGPALHHLGYWFVLVPVMLNSFILLFTALFYNNATKRRYPHKAPAPPPNRPDTIDAAPMDRVGITPNDLDAVLARYNQVLDISREDLESIVEQTEMQAYRRRFGDLRCKDVMSKDVIIAEFGTSLSDAWHRLHDHKVTALPVIDRANRVIGIVTKADFLEHADVKPHDGLSQRLTNLIRPSQQTHTEKEEVVGQIMTSEVHTALEDQPLVELVELMSDQRIHQVPIVNGQGKLVGILTQSDMIAALYESAFGK